MRGRGNSIPALAAAALLSLAPTAARALEWSGRLGLAYDRTDAWGGSEHAFVPRLRLEGDAAARGFVFAPGLLDWSGSVGYADDRSSYESGTSSSDALLRYSLGLGVLQTRIARAGMSARASRSRTDHSRDAEAGKTTGVSTIDDYAVTAFLRPPGLPTLEATYGYTDAVNSGLGRPTVSDTSRTLDLTSQFGQPNLRSELSYRMEWAEGSLPAANYDSQHLTLAASTDPAAGVRGDVRAQYFLRAPEALGTTNPRLETTTVDAGVRWEGAASRSAGGAAYRYVHDFATDPALQGRELLSHSTSAWHGRPLSADWRWTGTVSASYSERRLGDASVSSAATQAVGLGVDFLRPTMEILVGARAGVAEPDSGSPALGFGTDGTVRKTWTTPRHSLSFSYTLKFDSNLGPTGGWTFAQSLFAELAGGALGPLAWGGRLRASGARAGGGAFGDNANRSISVAGWIQYRRAVLDLELGTTDAASGALANPISDALFVPAGFNTHSRYAAATASVPLAERLSLRALARYTVLSGPGNPEQREALVNPGIWYAVGAWTFSLEDRYTAGGITSFDRRENLLWVRASRTLGGR